MRKVISYSVALLLPWVLSSCMDQTGSPAGPSGTAPGLAAGSQGGGNGPTSLDLIEGDFADGLLDRENANRYRQYAVSAPAKLPSKYRSTVRGKDATYSMLLLARDWDKLSSATKQEILDIRRNGYGNLSDTVATEHFVLHYTRQGNNAVPARDANGNGTPDFIDVAAQSWEQVWDREITQLGYPAPKGTPAQKFHVYYRDFFYYGSDSDGAGRRGPGVAGGEWLRDSVEQGSIDAHHRGPRRCGSPLRLRGSAELAAIQMSAAGRLGRPPDGWACVIHLGLRPSPPMRAGLHDSAVPSAALRACPEHREGAGSPDLGCSHEADPLRGEKARPDGRAFS